MTLLVLDAEAVELNESVIYYESKQAGLGGRFRDEVAAVVNQILRNPEFPRLRPKGYRRVNLRVFQHYVSHVIRGMSSGLLPLLTRIGGLNFGLPA